MGLSILRDLPPEIFVLTDAKAAIGGGSSPDETFPAVGIAIESREKPERILARLRDLDVPVIGIISDGRVVLNLARSGRKTFPIFVRPSEKSSRADRSCTSSALRAMSTTGKRSDRGLTGVNTDRLPEERRRGMTIDLGFAWFPGEEESRSASSMSRVTSVSFAI